MLVVHSYLTGNGCGVCLEDAADFTQAKVMMMEMIDAKRQLKTATPMTTPISAPPLKANCSTMAERSWYIHKHTAK